MIGNEKAEEKELLRMLLVIGNNVWFLTKLFLLCTIPSILNGLNIVSYVFMAANPDTYWCQIPELETANWTTQQILSVTSPHGGNSSCQMYDYNYTYLASLNYEDAVESVIGLPKKTITCDYHSFSDKPTLVRDFDLVCSRTALKSSIQMALSLGKLFGALFFGIISDKFGRKAAFSYALLLYAISGPMVALAPFYWLVFIGRIGLGAAGSGIYHPAFVLLSEISHKRHRAGLGIVFNMCYPVGMMITPLLAYLFTDWRTLQWSISIPAFVFLPFIWLLPESPLWQISKGKTSDASKFIRGEYAKLKNTGVDLDENMEVESLNQEESRETEPAKSILHAIARKVKLSMEQMTTLFKYTELRHRIFISFFLWGVANFSYYGLALNVDNFQLNPYVYIFLTGLFEVPSYLLPLPFVKYMGRRSSSIILFYIAGLSLLLILAIPDDVGMQGVVMAVASIGRLCISGVFAVVILLVTELCPTVLRSTAIGICSVASHAGSMSAPYFVDLGGMYSRYIPSTVFGMLAFAAGTLILILPETKNKQLPNSVQDILDAPKDSRVGLQQVCKR